MEEWRDIKGYEGAYQVSSYGRIRSLERIVVRWNGNGDYLAKEKILNIKPRPDGYMEVKLSKDNIKKSYKVHRLVAEAFIPNPNNLPCVNHKIDDYEHRSDNRVENLEWCTYEYNNNYGNHGKRISDVTKGDKNPRARKIICVTTGEKFDCITYAAKTYNVSRQSITHCLMGRQKTAGKHPETGEKLVWRYYES